LQTPSSLASAARSAAGVLLILLPLAFNAFFFLLGRAFEYPDILRRPTGEILSRLRSDDRPFRGLRT
jgi:hypothetical protein